MKFLAVSLVAGAGVFLIGLGLLSWANPERAKRFLLGFAGTARKHYLELGIRCIIGAAFVLAAPRLAGTGVVELTGWVLLITTGFMLLVPWRVHQAFTRRTVPKALAHLPVLGLVSCAAGAAILWAIIAASADKFP